MFNSNDFHQLILQALAGNPHDPDAFTRLDELAEGFGLADEYAAHLTAHESKGMGLDYHARLAFILAASGGVSCASETKKAANDE